MKTVQSQPEDAVQVAEVIRRHMAEPGGTEPTTAQFAVSTYAGGATANPTAGEEASLGGPDTGLPGAAGEVWIHEQLWWVQAGCFKAGSSKGEQEAQATEEQTVPAGGVSGAEGTGGCEARAC